MNPVLQPRSRRAAALPRSSSDDLAAPLELEARAVASRAALTETERERELLRKAWRFRAKLAHRTLVQALQRWHHEAKCAKLARTARVLERIEQDRAALDTSAGSLPRPMPLPHRGAGSSLKLGTPGARVNQAAAEVEKIIREIRSNLL